jgi:hypothetical protein
MAAYFVVLTAEDPILSKLIIVLPHIPISFNMDFLKQAQLVVEDATKTVQDTSAYLQHQSTDLIEQHLQPIAQTFEEWKTQVMGLGTAGVTIAEALKDLPRTAEELAREMPNVAGRLKNRAGLRVGDAPRSDADIMHLFEKIPGTSKLEASEYNVREFLSDKHGSHIKSRVHGGSNGADNIVWEVGADNLKRGARNMSGGEQVYIRLYNAADSLLKNSATIAKLGLATTGTAILTQALVTAASYALDLYRGEITVEEFKDRIVEAAVSAGIAAPIFFVILIAVLALFPEFALILSAPAIVTGFNALFGVGIATPIIQSIVRHIQAGGMGQEISDGYDNLMNEANHLIATSTQEVQKLAEGILPQGSA